MTGNDLAKAIKNTHGKISVGVAGPDKIIWIFAEKSDLIKWAKRIGDDETKMKLFFEETGSGVFLDIDYENF